MPLLASSRRAAGLLVFAHLVCCTTRRDDGPRARDQDGGSSSTADAAMTLDAGADAAIDASLDATTDGAANIELAARASEAVWQALDRSDKACRDDADCIAYGLSASCTDACATGAVSRDRGAGQPYEALVQIETELCMSGPALVKQTIFPNFGRIGAGSGCQSWAPSEARCVDEVCRETPPLCPEGCSPGASGLCEGSGDATCNGCPAFPGERQGSPCTQVGKRCDYHLACSIDFGVCEQQVGGAIWQIYVTLCQLGDCTSLTK